MSRSVVTNAAKVKSLAGAGPRPFLGSSATSPMRLRTATSAPMALAQNPSIAPFCKA